MKLRQPSQTAVKMQQTPKNKRMLDLFSGTGSAAAIFQQRGFQVTTLDLDPKWQADIQVNILEWEYRRLSPGWFHTIFAAPPCTEYSQAMTCRPRNLDLADAIVKKALEIIHYFAPVQWFLENPYTGLLKSRSFMSGYQSIQVDYCKFGPWGYR